MKVKTHLKAGKPMGDAVADLTHATGLDKVAQLYTDITGRDCGCQDRQAMLNRLLPASFVQKAA
ncbi:MAG: hypothetical protein KDJ52_07200 [Anaerolineae bacterium]|nr:hypothetical protein [Anaerolineae bacterium]